MIIQMRFTQTVVTSGNGKSVSIRQLAVHFQLDAIACPNSTLLFGSNPSSWGHIHDLATTKPSVSDLLLRNSHSRIAF